MNKKVKVYPAKLMFITEDNSYLVTFPDLQGCLTEGKTIKKALKNAQEALEVYLDGLTDIKVAFPASSKIAGEDIYQIEAELGTSSTYSESHKKSYETNREKILAGKKEKEKNLKEKGFKNLRTSLPIMALNKLDKLVKTKKTSRVKLLTELIEKEYQQAIQ